MKPDDGSEPDALAPLQVRGYSQQRFRDKLRRQALNAGKPLVERLLWLYYAAQRPDTPNWAKLTIATAIAYFILPLDVLPDFAPLFGYSDDLAAVTAALATIARYVDDAVKDEARQTLNSWFKIDNKD